MNLKLSDWASIAEIVSGIAVIVTLVFLVIGIRENTAITRAAMFDSTLQGLAGFRGHIIDDAELAELWDVYLARGYDDLDGANRTRTRQLVMLSFENQQRAFFARKYEVLGQSEWSRFEKQICLQYPRVAESEALSRGLQAVLTDEFWNYMTTTCISQQ